MSKSNRRTYRLSRDVMVPGRKTVLIARRSLWTPSLYQYLQSFGVKRVDVEAVDYYGRVLSRQPVLID